MAAEHLVPAEQFCLYHHIDITFIHSLKETGLIVTEFREEHMMIPETEIRRLERMVRLFYEMDINLEGIETIDYLLEKIRDMQERILLLNNKLERYEE